MVSLALVSTDELLNNNSVGWALTLLSQENLPYASTCQTIGLNTGYFASFTVFLALNSESFSYVDSTTLIDCTYAGVTDRDGASHVSI